VNNDCHCLVLYKAINYFLSCEKLVIKLEHWVLIIVFLLVKILSIIYLMTENQTILNYKGPIEFKTTELLLQKVKNDLESHNIKKVLKKRVYNIMVECIENILRHKAADPNTDIHPYIVLEKGEGEYFITSGNLIINEEVDLLKEKLNIVSRQNKKGLLKMYDNQINKEDIIEKDGAGLGIITIAIKSDSKINYTFTPVNEQFSVFELQVSVPFDQ
jgi:hypothetical protein